MNGSPETEMECNKTIWDRSVHSFIIGTNTCNKNDKNAETRTINCLDVYTKVITYAAITSVETI